MIQIKNPCDADWQKMTPAESGKYCGACEKVVVDFSKMNDAQIKNYFTEYATQKTCGRFLDSQLERPLVAPSLTVFAKFFNRLNQIPGTRTILFFLTTASMWISGCVKNNDAMTTGESVAPTDTAESCAGELMGLAAPILDPEDSLVIKEDTIKMGETIPEQTTKMLPPDFLMGDVEVCTPPDVIDTVAVTIPSTSPDSSDVTIHMIKGKVMMADTISQKIKRRKK